MTNVVDIRSKLPHMEGDAVCLDCGAKWVAVTEIGVFYFECPKCGSLKGIFSAPVIPDTAWVCQCGNMFFTITPNHAMCARCGLAQNFW